jgi:hypothetical protein
MKELLYKFLRSGLLSFVVLVGWNIVTSTFLPEVSSNLRLEVSSLFVVYFALKRNESWLPWAVLYIEFLQSLFSVAAWGQNVIAGILLLLIARVIRELINVNHILASFLFIELLLLIRYVISSFIWSVKIESLDMWGGMILGYLPQSFILSLLAIPFFKLLSFIWKERKVEEAF